MMALLLDRRDAQIQITSDAVIMICGNFNKLLLNRRCGQIQITEDVVKAVASNYRNGKK